MRKKTLNSLFVLVAGLLTASGTFKALNHDTTALLLFIAAIVLFFLTASLWLPRALSKLRAAPAKIPIDPSAPTQALEEATPTFQPSVKPKPGPAPKLVSTEGKTEPQPNAPETPQVAKPPDADAPVYPAHCFHSGYGDQWTEYTEDTFYGVLWRWRYQKEIDKTPRSLTPLCPECDSPTPMSGRSNRRFGPYQYLQCRYHPQRYKIDEGYSQTGDPFPKTKDLILQRLEDDSWVDVVNKQRMARHQAPIGGPIKADVALPEVSILILRILAKNGGSCTRNEFYNTLGHLRYLEQTPSPDEVSIQFHLHELEEKHKYISVERGPYADGISLTQPGRKFAIDHGLNKPDKKSNKDTAHRPQEDS
ncbi:MAG: hypothetical protein AABO41_26810 [Acidobacteriota bacterium]